ncbi:hypothetical protein ElyMa_002937600 [Elysia marginata]|uniref:Uncharacterized protein n=1 Tax=Elysia marginata TaxID=1093978 RepID=A0AAV4I8H2_9GAST|nr:hypothetical protein ElyMa_002937600 [Elysia marginata]
MPLEIASNGEVSYSVTNLDSALTMLMAVYMYGEEAVKDTKQIALRNTTAVTAKISVSASYFEHLAWLAARTWKPLFSCYFPIHDAIWTLTGGMRASQPQRRWWSLRSQYRSNHPHINSSDFKTSTDVIVA